MTRQWQEMVQKRLKDRSMSQAELARLIGVKPPSITAMLKPGAKQSRLVPRVQKVLGMGRPELPASSVVDDKRTRLAEAFEKLSPEEVEAVISLAESLAKRSGK